MEKEVRYNENGEINMIQGGSDNSSDEDIKQDGLIEGISQQVEHEAVCAMVEITNDILSKYPELGNEDVADELMFLCFTCGLEAALERENPQRDKGYLMYAHIALNCYMTMNMTPERIKEHNITTEQVMEESLQYKKARYSDNPLVQEMWADSTLLFHNLIEFKDGANADVS